MNAETKVKAETVEQVIDKADEERRERMRIWNAVSRTNPNHTKQVEFGRKFTAIDAHYQIQMATEQFGPIGEGWGYTTGEIAFVDGLVIVPVTLWHGDRGTSFGPLYGSTTLRDRKGNIDKDAPKKATTDALTKALSQLGFNADVFLGKFDDNKYVAELTKEFSGPPANDAKQQGAGPPANGNGDHKDDPFPQGPCKNKTELKTKGRELWREIEGCGDSDEFEILLAEKGTVALVNQIMKALPNWWDGGHDKNGEVFEGLEAVIARKRRDFEQLAHVPA